MNPLHWKDVPLLETLAQDILKIDRVEIPKRMSSKKQQEKGEMISRAKDFETECIYVWLQCTTCEWCPVGGDIWDLVKLS